MAIEGRSAAKRSADVQSPLASIPTPSAASASVVGAVAQAKGPVGGDELNAVQYLLNRLVRQQKLGGDYAATVVRETGRPEVYFAFADEADARKFGDTVQAEATDRYSG